MARSAATTPEPQPSVVALCVALAVATVFAFLPVLHNGFVNFDDDEYVTANPHVLSGLSWDGLRWALTSGHAANWHPLTWLSHQLDATLFGSAPAGVHAVSLALHVANALLLFLLARRLTRATGPSAMLAALFALHPLHVESVAWAAERKDVLSTLLWILTTWAWVRWTERPSTPRYAAVVTLFALGLAAKPMLVTLPLTLLLLDVWPLARRRGVQLIVEKLPLFALAAAAAVVTLLVQRAGGALRPALVIPFGERASNAAVAAVSYLGKMLWPARLAVFYPHPGPTLAAWKVAGALALLVAISAAAVVWRRRAPWFAAGWAWYLVTLLPVIGLVQVGEQAMADRYTYVPLLGIFVSICWSVPARLQRPAFAAVPVVVLVALGASTHVQCLTWRDSVSLFRHALAVTEDNHVAHLNLAMALGAERTLDEALVHLREAVRLAPNRVEARANLGAALFEANQLDEAKAQFEAALRLDPRDLPSLTNLGAIVAMRGDQPAAMRLFREALALDPASVAAHAGLGLTLLDAHDTAGAIPHLREAVRLAPDDLRAYAPLAAALRRQGDGAGAAAVEAEAKRRGGR